MKPFNPILFLFLGFFGCRPTTPSTSEKELLTHWSQGSMYRIINDNYKSAELNSMLRIADSIRQKPSSKDQSLHLCDSDGTQYSLGIGIPADLKQDGLYPVVIYLHGGVRTDVSTKGDHAYEMLNQLRDSMDLIIASPSANRFAPWWSPRGLMRILQTIRYLSTHYSIDTSKIFLAGVSDGATGCYAAAVTINGPFAGFIAISGYGGMLPNLGIPISLNNLKRRPIYNVQGGKDQLYPPSVTDRFLDFLEKEDVPITRKLYPEEDHGFSYKEAEIPFLVELIRSWSRPEENGFNWEIIEGFPNAPDQILGFELIEKKQKAILNVKFENNTMNIESNNLQTIHLTAPHKSKVVARDSQISRYTEGEFSKKNAPHFLFHRISLFSEGTSLYSIHFRR